MAKKAEPKPFHESILNTILCCSGPKLEFLASIIKATKIPKNHDQIIAAWNTRAEEMGWDNGDYGVTAHLLAQKEASGKKQQESGKETTSSAEAVEATVQ